MPNLAGRVSGEFTHANGNPLDSFAKRQREAKVKKVKVWCCHGVSFPGHHERLENESNPN
jgi:hypothetical protein